MLKNYIVIRSVDLKISDLSFMIKHINFNLSSFTDDERIEILNEIFKGYCKDCGQKIGDRTCYCKNDE